ncbi:type II/IV secretion system protein, partial [Candidatus Peregrinibacteria bacterium]|nr:type II/IV secretion system protein [Candidatus Peregrinibacteria bacterium]
SYTKIKLVENVEEKSINTYEKEIESLADIPLKLAAVTAEEGINLMNIGAMKTHASDIHYEPEEGKIVVRFRIDGVLHKIFEIKPDVYKNLANQLKYQSRMQLNVATIPQDGRYVFNFNEKKIAVRVSTIPTPYGESFVCRYLVGDDQAADFAELGFQGLALKKLQNVCNISHGMVLATGPTGSGKSTTLYALLRKMTTPQNKVITLEDPVEYNITGVTQSQIDEKHGYNFANGLRAVLRQDPDVVMLGEIRDLETAQTAAQAALTGHIVLSTLHTNSAIESIPRLINMGLAPFMVAPALDTIIAQRLVRKVCNACSTLENIPDSAKKEFEETMKNLAKVNPAAVVQVPEKVPTVHGCKACSNTGYTGRIVLAEVITINNELKDLVLNNASTVDLITAVRKEGIITMREDGFLKVAQGLTTLEEVFRVTNISDSNG